MCLGGSGAVINAYFMCLGRLGNVTYLYLTCHGGSEKLQLVTKLKGVKGRYERGWVR